MSGRQRDDSMLSNTDSVGNQGGSGDEEHDLLNLPSVEKKSFFSRAMDRLPNMPQRVIICLLAHFGFGNLYILRGDLSVAIIPMTANYSVVVNDTLTSKSDFSWSLSYQGILHSAFYYGYLFTQLPGGYLAMYYGGRTLFGLSVCATAVITMLTPLAAKLDYGVLLFIRYLCGFCEGPSYPAMQAMWSEWAPPNERSRLATIAFSGAYFGTAYCLMIATFLNDAFGWESIFYASGLTSLVWAFFWFCWGGETPRADKFITRKERDYILDSIGSQEKTKNIKIPWRHILLSTRVWAICFCHFAANWGFYTLLTQLPTFLSDALKFDLGAISDGSSTPFFVMGIMTICGGFLADSIVALNVISITNTRKAIIFVTFIIQMVLFFIVGKLPSTPESHSTIMTCFVVILACTGLSWAGFSVNFLDIAPDYAGVLFGMSNMIATLPGVISPMLTGFLVTSKDDIASWSVVFVIAGYMYLFALVFYMLFGSGERQHWANSTETNRLTSATGSCGTIENTSTAILEH